MNRIAEPILKADALLGEGSIWDAENNVLHWVDINRFAIHTFYPETGENKEIILDKHVGTVVKRASGGFVVGLGRSLAHVNLSGEVAVFAEIERELASSRMNDGKCDPVGRFWCGSISEEPNNGNLWMLDLDKQLHHKVENVSCSNGLVWTADGKTMYYIDTPTGSLDAFDYDLATGAIKNRREVLRNGWGGHFDGMTIDENDNLYIAIWGGGAVYKIDPVKQRLLEKITVPGVKNVTSCAFGGEDLSDLYITSSSLGADLIDEPNAGSLFRIALNDTKGRPAFKFLG